MVKLGFVFPGQGSQVTGMGKELADNFEEAAKIYTEADKLAPYKISSICFDGPQELLDQTEYSQPAILVTSLACLAVAQKHGLSAQAMAGLSLGEYTALVASGSLTIEEALPLVMKRAQLMQKAVPEGKGAMAAVMGLDINIVEEACNNTTGIVQIANYNCPKQLVLSGEKEAIDEVSSLLKDNGGRIRPLSISVPSHSPLMKQCSEDFKAELNTVKFKESSTMVFSNVNASTNSNSDLVDILAQQLYSPVLWEQSIRNMMKNIDYIVEIGPGSSLSGLIKKIDKNIVLGQINNLKSLEKTLERIGKL
ncbi:Malonyl CoA-acyl carrier protein transacylase [Candidatus Syntrophocurvum alkaliphilum]|uniref:Malonyl CoA-acyl carrier protein transacylase n=1 Tax=Candidatus Syntrophocurvum alkaliphilum TaxID=2293317 RepID=A0A6I6DB38_9FIRM|nr:ACP S-malonyltransferase [Candidatus Syntrophocurvum alkaliphilum]QGT98714.1 Malonyl CoA-acyl carrier protein transacylase [Candidatus Syntrophocurvum alkaliphilum]